MTFCKCFFVSIDTVLVAQKPGLEYITFNWNKMTASEFEEQWKAKKITKKADFIHMIQVGVGADASVLLAYRL